MLLFWFSQEEPNWSSIVKDGRRIFKQNGYKLHDWENCSVNTFPTDGGKVRVNVRKKNIQYSNYMKKNIEIRFLYSFEISSIHEPVIEKYEQTSSNNNNNSSRNDSGQEARWAIHLKKEGNEHQERRNCSIWQWASQGDIRQSEVFRLFEDIDNKFRSPHHNMNIDDVQSDTCDQVMPLIIQPSTDGWKNFVRQVHCAKKSDSEYEFTLVFNDEHLRENRVLESFYRFLRPYLYGRLTDIESFKLILEEKSASYFIFPGIYSGKNNITKDSIHGDKEWFFQKAPRRRVKYHYSNKIHPIVFMNTANHALGEEDNNGTLWKWEYDACAHDSPIVHGNKSRKEIEDLVKNLDENEAIRNTADLLRQENISSKMLMTDQELRKKWVDHIRREYIVNKTTAEKLLTETIRSL